MRAWCWRRRRQCDQCRMWSAVTGRRSVRRVISRRISARLRWMSWEDPFLLCRCPVRGLAGLSSRRGRRWPGSCGGVSRDSGGPGSRPGRIPASRSEAFLDGPPAARHADQVVEGGFGGAVGDVVGDVPRPADAAAGDDLVAAIRPVPGPHLDASPVVDPQAVSPVPQERRFHFCRGRPLNRSWTGRSIAQRVTTVSCRAVAMTWKTSACSSSKRQLSTCK